MAPKRRLHSKEIAGEGPLVKKAKVTKKSLGRSKQESQKFKLKSPKRKDGTPRSKDRKSPAKDIQNKKTTSATHAQTKEEIKRDKHGKLVFPDYPQFKPNLTPKEVLQAGSFGGTYYRPIKSSVTGEKYSGEWKEFPSDWLEGLSISNQVASPTYHADVNTYKVKCGGSLEMWESRGWIVRQDPYGWFQWYCRFYIGRRTEDDERQISRWLKCTGDKGRWRNNLITKIVHSGCSYDNSGVSPVVRQTLQHWGYRLNKDDYDKQAKNVKTK